MTIAVDKGRKATKTKQKNIQMLSPHRAVGDVYQRPFKEIFKGKFEKKLTLKRNAFQMIA